MKLRKTLSLLLAAALLAACLPLAASAVDVSVGFSGADLVLSDSIGIRFYADKATVTGARKYVGSYATLSFDVNRDGTPETVTIEPEEVTVGGTAYFRYTFVGIAPDKMGETVTAQLHIRRSDGQIGDGQTVSYAVKDYVLHTAGKDAVVDVLLADLIAYGRAAEAYTGEGSLPASGSEADELDALVSAYAHTEEVATTAASNARRHYYTAGVTAANAKVTFTSVGLNLRDNAAILYAFAPASGEDIADYSLKVKVDDATYTYGADAFEENAGAYLFRFRELQPTQMKTAVRAWFVDGSGTPASANLCYSVETYVYQCWKNRASAPTLNALTQALLRYGNACDKYFNEIIDYFDVDAAFAASGRSMTADVSDLFPASEEGYLVNGGTAAQPYLVDYDTILRLAGGNVVGSGYVKWINFTVRDKQSGPDAALTGEIPVSKLNDPVYMEMALPTEANYYYADRSKTPAQVWSVPNGNRANAFNMVQPRALHENIINMGALYLNYETDAPGANDSITICLKDFRIYAHKSGRPAGEWILMESVAAPDVSQIANKVAISWSGGNNSVASKYTNLGDHVELALKGGDLWTDSDWKTNTAHQFLIHFWGKQIDFADKGLSPEQVDGVVCSYTVWVKEAAMAGKLLATVGADLRPGLYPETYSDYLTYTGSDVYKSINSSGQTVGSATPKMDGSSYHYTNQVVSSRAVCVPATPRVVFCHNVTTANYDSVIDTDTVQALIGLK